MPPGRLAALILLPGARASVSSSVKQAATPGPTPHLVGMRPWECGGLVLSTGPGRGTGQMRGGGQARLQAEAHLGAPCRHPGKVLQEDQQQQRWPLGGQAPRPLPAWLSPQGSPCVLGRWDSCVDRPRATSGLRLSGVQR